MKYLLLALFLFFYSLATAQYHYHTIAKAPMRKTASTKGQVLIVIPKNTAVNIEKVENNWLFGFYHGRKGYISKKLVKEDKPVK